MAFEPVAQLDEQYQLLPGLTTDEFAALKADIAERGVMVPIEFDENGTVLDGHHRLRACAELGIVEYPTIIRQGMTEGEKREHVLALNLDRRHLTREQRRDLIAELLRAKPEASNREIAGQAKADDHTVATVRQELQAGAEIPHVEVAVGRDGKTYPSHRPAPVMAPTRQEAEHSLELLTSEEQSKDDPSEDDPIPGFEPPTRAHVANNSGDNEWYTPEEYIVAAREVMGGIDLDPASTAVANEVVGAARFYTAEEDGLAQEWTGRVWMNPPYAQPLMGQFAEKLVAELGNVEQAIVLVNNATETQWFQGMGEAATAICFPKGRVRFWAPDKVSAPLQGQAILYFGDTPARFCEVFAQFGLVVIA